jgi:anti-anti-sigma factor
VEGLGAAKTYATRFRYDLNTNRELIGLGAANLGSGFSGGMVVNGSLSKTAVNAGAGAKSQLAGLVVAVLTILTLLFLTGLFEDLPEATLAGVVIAALVELVDIRTLVRLYRVHTSRLGNLYGVAARPDFLAAIAALFGVLLFDTLPGLFIGIGVSLVLLIYRSARPHIARLGEAPGSVGQFNDLDRHPANRVQPGVIVLRVEGGLFFANADAVRERIREEARTPGVRAVVLDAETVPFIDVTASKMLTELHEDLEGTGVELIVARDIGQVADVLRAEAGHRFPIRVFPTVADAVKAAAAAPPRSAARDVTGPA